MSIRVTRLFDEPLIRPRMDARMGENICGPALIRVPDWVADPLGRYYLYFAHHKGRYIRLAHADDLAGPWRMHEPGVLDVSRSLFVAEDMDGPPPGADSAMAKVSDEFYAHVASPDVHLDHENRRIRMYYHGMLETGDQGTRVAYSGDGLSFEPREPVLGPAYVRVFQHAGAFYTVCWRGTLWRSADWDQPFEECGELVPPEIVDGVERGFRHGESHVTGDTLHLFYTRMGDRPERMLYSAVRLAADWRDWRMADPVTVLEPELTWEGGDLPLTTSRVGWAPTRLRELRDPCVFTDIDGRTYLLYSGAGEAGIGIARIEGF